MGSFRESQTVAPSGRMVLRLYPKTLRCAGGNCFAARRTSIWRRTRALSRPGGGQKNMAGTTLTDRLFDDADTAPIDPCSLFEEWFTLAQQSEPNDPHAMALA